MLHKPEYRLKSRSGQDRSVNHKNYARTTDKGFPLGRIYSLLSRYNKMKRELRSRAVQEMPDDLIYGLDMKSMKFYTRGYFQKEISPDGLQYFRVNTTCPAGEESLAA